jgi:hypothetical protein
MREAAKQVEEIEALLLTNDELTHMQLDALWIYEELDKPPDQWSIGQEAPFVLQRTEEARRVLSSERLGLEPDTPCQDTADRSQEWAAPVAASFTGYGCWLEGSYLDC